MAMVSFPDGSYLELVAPQTKNHPWARFLSGHAGPCAWAVAASDLDSELHRWESRSPVSGSG
jgi:hypothetical protein